MPERGSGGATVFRDDLDIFVSGTEALDICTWRQGKIAAFVPVLVVALITWWSCGEVFQQTCLTNIATL